MWTTGVFFFNVFWEIWRDEYILSFREGKQSSLKFGRIKTPFPIEVDDIVIVTDNMPRGCWKMGRVTEVIRSLENNVRAAMIKTSSGKVLNRPLKLLYPIECSKNYRGKHVEIKSKTETDSLIRDRSVRRAAVQARQKIKARIMC